MNHKECIIPITFASGESAGTRMKTWSERLKNSSIVISDSDNMSMTQQVADNLNPYHNMNGFTSLVCKKNDIGKEEMHDYERLAYANQIGKKKADLEAEIVREKIKEYTGVTHGFSERGYVRDKSFADGCISSHAIAYGRIEKVQHWFIADKEYARLLISDTTPSYISRGAEWTNVFDVSKLEKDKFVEELMSRHFRPSNSKAYDLASIKDFRSRIYEEIRIAKPEKVYTKAGWHKVGNRRVYYDGKDFPRNTHMLSYLRCSCRKTHITIEEVLEGIYEEIEKNDIGNRLSFLIGYGMVAWFSSFFALNWNKCPGIMLLGREDVCRRYSEACLKMYVRTEGTDIVEISETTKKTLVEYVDVLKDDVFIFNGYELSGNVLKIAKSIVAGRSVSNKTLNTPIVVLQNIPHNELIYDNYVTVDLNGFKVSERFCLCMQELKGILISILESLFYEENETSNYRFVTYEEATKVIFSFIKQYLSEQKVPMAILERFFKELELGTNIKDCFCGNEKDTWVHMLSQRLEEAIINAQVSVSGDIDIKQASNPKHSLVVRGDSVYIPAEYLDNGFLASINLSQSNFRRVRDVLMERNLLDTYKGEKGYTKKISVSGDRIHAYKLDKSLFTIFEKYGF